MAESKEPSSWGYRPASVVLLEKVEQGCSNPERGAFSVNEPDKRQKVSAYITTQEIVEAVICKHRHEGRRWVTRLCNPVKLRL